MQQLRIDDYQKYELSI